MKMASIIDVQEYDRIYIPTTEGFVFGRVFRKTYIGEDKYSIELNNIDETFTIHSDNFVIKE
jgi:hypothetical protein